MDNSNSASILYGKGVFTTIAIFGGNPFLWEKHWRRLALNAETVGISLADLNEIGVRQDLKAAIEAQGIGNGRARITIYDDRPSELWSAGDHDGPATRVEILTGELRPAPESLTVTLSPYPVNSRSPLARVKSCNYLENLLAIDEAKKRGYHEAIRLNERGEVASACMANVFWLKGGELSTPALSTGCLPGTTREYILENVDCSEVTAPLEELWAADAVFLTSAGLGIVEAARFETTGMRLSGHPILTLLPATR